MGTFGDDCRQLWLLAIGPVDAVCCPHSIMRGFCQCKVGKPRGWHADRAASLLHSAAVDELMGRWHSDNTHESMPEKSKDGGIQHMIGCSVMCSCWWCVMSCEEALEPHRPLHVCEWHQ
jgi:hypothetical protein